MNNKIESTFGILKSSTSTVPFSGECTYNSNIYTATTYTAFADLVAALIGFGFDITSNIERLLVLFAPKMSEAEFRSAISAEAQLALDSLLSPVTGGDSPVLIDEVEIDAALVPKVEIAAKRLPAFNSEIKLTLAELRTKKLALLNSWWDNHPGIEVQPGIVLPMDKASIGAMAAAANVAEQMGVDLSLDDVNDKTVIIPAAQIQTAIGTFYVKLNEMRAKWDTLLAQIESAKTIEELAAITIG